jgi:hypothetical protein
MSDGPQKATGSLPVAIMATLAFSYVATRAFIFLGTGVGIFVEGSLAPAALPVAIASGLIFQRIRFGSIGGAPRPEAEKTQSRSAGLGVAWVIAFIAYCVLRCRPRRRGPVRCRRMGMERSGRSVYRGSRIRPQPSKPPRLDSTG